MAIAANTPLTVRRDPMFHLLNPAITITSNPIMKHQVVSLHSEAMDSQRITRVTSQRMLPIRRPQVTQKVSNLRKDPAMPSLLRATALAAPVATEVPIMDQVMAQAVELFLAMVSIKRATKLSLRNMNQTLTTRGSDQRLLCSRDPVSHSTRRIPQPQPQGPRIDNKSST